MSFKIAPIDWAAEMARLTYAQFRRTVTWPKMAAMFARQAQDLEDSGQSLLTLTSIDDSEGVQLDTLGALVRQLRSVVDDPTYRLYLRARVLANKSSGSVEELYAVFRALFGQTAGMQVATEIAGSDVKTFVARITSVLTSVQAMVGLAFLGDAKDTGARAIFIWQEAADDLSFTCADGTYVTTQNTVGATSLEVMDLGVAASGTVVIDPGLATQEITSFTRTDPTHIAVTALGQVHPVGAFVEFVGDPGIGFPASCALTIPASIGDTLLAVDATGGFDSSGSIIIDEGLPSEETVSYAVSGGTNLVVPALAKAHPLGAAVIEVGSGGSMAGAAQA